MNPNEPQYVTIDGVQYNVLSLTPQTRGTLSLFETARQRMQNAQIELAMSQAAMNHFGAELRAQLQHQQPALPNVAKPKAQKPPARHPANQNSTRGRKKR